MLDQGKQIEMHVYDYSSEVNQKLPKYTLHLVDSNDPKLLSQNTMAAIITPQGREKDSVFSTEKGRQNLCSQANVARCVVIILGAGHTFAGLEDVQKELNAKILELAPNLCSNYENIPIMSAAADIG